MHYGILHLIKKNRTRFDEYVTLKIETMRVYEYCILYLKKKVRKNKRA